MNDLEQLTKLGLKVYHPGGEGRTFKLPGGGIWKSSDEGVLFFETDHYQCYTDATWVGALLETLVERVPVRLIGLKVDPMELKEMPEWVMRSRFSDRGVEAVFRRKKLADAVAFFDRVANYGIWNFYGLSLEQDEEFEGMPNVLGSCKKYAFFVGIDLDGLLMGYLQLGGGADVFPQ